jgi:hypothetical protein
MEKKFQQMTQHKKSMAQLISMGSWISKDSNIMLFIRDGSSFVVLTYIGIDLLKISNKRVTLCSRVKP